MRKAVAGLLVLASCSSLRQGTEHYHEGMLRAGRDPVRAQDHFARAEELLAEAMAEEDLSAAETATALANRVRSLVELDRHADAAALLEARIEGYDPARRYAGDLTGLALLRAHHLDPERGYAQLVLAERWANSEPARLHVAWQQARFLRKIGTPKAKEEAVRICRQHAGKLDFDAMKQELSAP